MLRKLIAPLVPFAAVAAIAAAPAGAELPPGNGLFTPPVTFACEGVGDSTVLSPPTGHATSNWTVITGEHTVAKSFTAVFTLLPSGGGTPLYLGTESISYGQKTGLGPDRTCKTSLDVPVAEGLEHID